MSSAIVKWFQERASQFTGPILLDEPLAKHTYFRIGGPASILVMPKGLDDLKLIAQGIAETSTRFFIMGQGSNLLVADAGFEGLVIRTQKMNLETRLEGGARLITGASVAVSSLLRKCSGEGWGGMEFLTGIPGLMGGVIKMNAGTLIGEAGGHVKKVRSYSLGQWPWKEANVFEGKDLQFEYRKNFFLPASDVVWEVEWEITQETPEAVRTKIQNILDRRKSTQPLDYPSCGSVFKNPKASGLSAWQVIDKLGLRGHQIGEAQFSEKHSNFILNLGGAKATDVKALIDLAKKRAKEELRIELEEEVIYLK